MKINKHDEIILKRVNKFNEIRDEKDFNLVEEIADGLYKLGNQNTRHIFLNNPLIKEIYNKKPEVQMVLLIKYFIEQLLIFRSVDGYNVTSLIGTLSYKTDYYTWLLNFKNVVLNFITSNNVLVINDSLLNDNK